MKILSFSHIFPPAIDGGSQAIYQPAKRLEKNHQVIYLSSKATSSDEYTKNIFSRLARKLDLPIGPYFEPLKFIKILLKLNKFKPDWIIAGPFPTTVALYCRLFQILFKCKVLFKPSYHQADKTHNSKILLSTLKHFHVLTNTIYEKKLLSRYCPNIIQHFPGINPIYFQNLKPKVRNSKSISLVFVGSIAAHKGVLGLIKSLDYLPKNFNLTIVGQSTLYYQNNVRHFKETNRLRLSIKKHTDLEIYNFINSSDILCLPSSEESFGLVYAEATALGKKILGIDTPVSKEVFSKLNSGLLSPNKDPKDIAKTILKLAKFKPSPNSQQFVKDNCNWDNITTWLNSYISSH